MFQTWVNIPFLIVWRLSHIFLELLGTASQNVALWYWSINHHLYRSLTHSGSLSLSLDVHLFLNFSDFLCFQVFPLHWWMSLAPDIITYSQASLLVTLLSRWLCTCLVVNTVSQSHPQLLHKLCHRYSMNTSTNVTLPSKYSLCLLVCIIWLKCKWLISSSFSMFVVTCLQFTTWPSSSPSSRPNTQASHLSLHHLSILSLDTTLKWSQIFSI